MGLGLGGFGLRQGCLGLGQRQVEADGVDLEKRFARMYRLIVMHENLHHRPGDIRCQ